jgi:hypothetical protein
MALKGEQFHNTYMPGRPDWLSPEHHTQQGPHHLTKLHDIGGMVHDGVQINNMSSSELASRLDPPVTADEITTFDVKTNPQDFRNNKSTFGELQVNNAPEPSPQEELIPGTARQGMLFDPYTGTGLPRDPTVSKEQRLAAVDRQLDLRGGGAPQLHETYATGDTPVSEFDRPIIRSPHGDKAGASTMKSSEGDEQLVAKRPKIKQGRGKRGGGMYQPRTNTATVQSLRGQRVVDYPTRSLTRPTKDAVSTGTSWNPDWYTGGSTGTGKGIMPKGSKVEDDAYHADVTREILRHSFHNPETGETLDPHTTPSKPVLMPWREDADSGRNFNTIIITPHSTSGRKPTDQDYYRDRRQVTGTRGESDAHRHLGRFDPRSESAKENDWMDSWSASQTLKDLHEAGFQSELHRGTGVTGDHSRLPLSDDPDDTEFGQLQPRREFHPKRSSLPFGTDPRHFDPKEGRRYGPSPVMLPTKAAEGFMTKYVEGGEKYDDSYIRSTTAHFHKRRIPSETENVERHYEQVTEWPDTSTAFHEREHAIDPSIGLRTVNRGDTRDAHRDPVHEGVADAASDRTIRYANVHEDALSPSLNPNRAKDIQDQSGGARGYGTKHKSWKRDQDRAVYAATRIHSAMADEPNIPDRVDLVIEQHGPRGFGKVTSTGRSLDTLTDTNIHSERNTDIANDTLLGKLYHENVHVRDGLDQLGFGRVGAQAAEKHVRRMDDAVYAAEEAAPDETQLSFWPREGVNE